MNEEKYNRIAWNEEVLRDNFWTRIVDGEAIEKARTGYPEIRVTPSSFVPFEWLEELKNTKILNLAGAGGQQTPILSAWGAEVTTVDLSEGQLEQDRKSLEKYGLKAELIHGDMRMTGLHQEIFDGVISPHAMNFIDDLSQVYSEVYRVLKPEGIFIFGIANPVLYIFDDKVQERKLKVKYTLPFKDPVSLSRKELEKRIKNKDTIEYSHTLDSIIGGLLKTGFVLEAFYSDKAASEPTDSFIHDSFLAFKARRI